MAEQNADGRYPPFRLSLSPIESDPTVSPGSTADQSATNHEIDIGAGDPDLPPLNFNIPCQQASQEHMSPDQRLSPVDSRRQMAPPVAHQAFEAAPTPYNAYLLRLARQVRPHSHQSKHTYTSTDPASPLASSSPNRSEYHSSYRQAEPKMQMHAPEVAHDDQTSSHGSPAQHAGASTITNPPNPESPPSGNDRLLHGSFAHANAERERLFRKPLKNIDGDDVEEVDQHKGEYALIIAKALSCKDFLPPPESKSATKKDDFGNAVKTSEDEKASWVKWQKNGQDNFETRLNKQDLKAVPEWSEIQYRAWEVIDEIIKLHHHGSHTTKQNTKPNAQQKEHGTLNCSARVEEAARVIKGYARIRAKVLKGHDIPKFCISSGTYVQVTIAAFWNNSGRPERNNTVSGAVPSQQVAKKDESVARGSGKCRKKQPATTKGNGSVVSGESVEQEPISAVSSDTRANGSSAVDADGGGEDEDAEGQSDGDATVEQVSNNAMPAVNNGRLGHDTFGYAPDHASLRRSSYDRVPYAYTFGHDPTTMSGFHHPIQATPHGLGSQGAFGLPAQRYPMPAPLSFGSGFISSTPPDAGYQQHNVYPLHGLPIVPNPAAGYTTDYAMTSHPSAGLSNSQGPQNDVRETHTRKRRKFEQ